MDININKMNLEVGKGKRSNPFSPATQKKKKKKKKKKKNSGEKKTHSPSPPPSVEAPLPGALLAPLEPERLESRLLPGGPQLLRGEGAFGALEQRGEAPRERAGRDLFRKLEPRRRRPQRPLEEARRLRELREALAEPSLALARAPVPQLGAHRLARQQPPEQDGRAEHDPRGLRVAELERRKVSDSLRDLPAAALEQLDVFLRDVQRVVEDRGVVREEVGEVLPVDADGADPGLCESLKFVKV